MTRSRSGELVNNQLAQFRPLHSSLEQSLVHRFHQRPAFVHEKDSDYRYKDDFVVANGQNMQLRHFN